MDTRNGHRAKLIAMAVVLATITGTAVAMSAMSAAGHKPVTVIAHFQDTVGLYPGNAVAVLGVPVGKVLSVAPKDEYVEVKLEIDDGVDIPADVQAVTVSTSILTDRHVELTPPYQSGPKLIDGDVLGMSRTRTPVEFDRTLKMADKLSRALGGDGNGQGPLADLIGIGNQVATGRAQDIKDALGRLSDALRLSPDNGAATKADIESIANSLADLMKSAADNDTTIRDFGSNIRQLSDIVADENLGTGNTGAQLNQILAEATTLLENNRDHIKATVANGDVALRALAGNRRELAEILDVLPLLGDNIYNAIDRDAGAIRVHALLDKLLLNGQMTKEVCNLAGMKDLGCNTGTVNDYAPDFGANFFTESMTGLLANMAGPAR